MGSVDVLLLFQLLWRAQEPSLLWEGALCHGGEVWVVCDGGAVAVL